PPHGREGLEGLSKIRQEFWFSLTPCQSSSPSYQLLLATPILWRDVFSYALRLASPARSLTTEYRLPSPGTAVPGPTPQSWGPEPRCSVMLLTGSATDATCFHI